MWCIVIIHFFGNILRTPTLQSQAESHPHPTHLFIQHLWDESELWLRDKLLSQHQWAAPLIHFWQRMHFSWELFPGGDWSLLAAQSWYEMSSVQIWACCLGQMKNHVTKLAYYKTYKTFSFFACWFCTFLLTPCHFISLFLFSLSLSLSFTHSIALLWSSCPPPFIIPPLSPTQNYYFFDVLPVENKSIFLAINLSFGMGSHTWVVGAATFSQFQLGLESYVCVFVFVIECVYMNMKGMYPVVIRAEMQHEGNQR